MQNDYLVARLLEADRGVFVYGVDDDAVVFKIEPFPDGF